MARVHSIISDLGMCGHRFVLVQITIFMERPNNRDSTHRHTTLPMVLFYIQLNGLRELPLHDLRAGKKERTTQRRSNNNRKKNDTMVSSQARCRSVSHPSAAPQGMGRNTCVCLSCKVSMYKHPSPFYPSLHFWITSVTAECVSSVIILSCR
jgi:hypothetical protein